MQLNVLVLNGSITKADPSCVYSSRADIARWAHKSRLGPSFALQISPKFAQHIRRRPEQHLKYANRACVRWICMLASQPAAHRAFVILVRLGSWSRAAAGLGDDHRPSQIADITACLQRAHTQHNYKQLLVRSNRRWLLRLVRSLALTHGGARFKHVINKVDHRQPQQQW